MNKLDEQLLKIMVQLGTWDPEVIGLMGNEREEKFYLSFREQNPVEKMN